MNDFLYNLLLEAKKHSKGSYVVQKVYGGRMTETAWKRLFESYMEALRVADGADENNLCFSDECFEEFTAHQLRHTYCSMLQWSGVDIKLRRGLHRRPAPHDTLRVPRIRASFILKLKTITDTLRHPLLFLAGAEGLVLAFRLGARFTYDSFVKK